MVIDISENTKKLNALSDYMGIWIDSKWDEHNFMITFWKFFNLGMLITPSIAKIELIDFETYYQKIKANEIKNKILKG